MKIAQYCSGLEALVSTSQQELSRQVSGRVAALVQPPGAGRISTFKLVKQAMVIVLRPFVATRKCRDILSGQQHERSRVSFEPNRDCISLSSDNDGASCQLGIRGQSAGEASARVKDLPRRRQWRACLEILRSTISIELL